jgi:hypothetical protein
MAGSSMMLPTMAISATPQPSRGGLALGGRGGGCGCCPSSLTFAGPGSLHGSA